MVRGWLKELEDRLTGRPDDDLVRLCGKLLRIAPERLRSLDPRQILAQAERKLATEPDRIRRAVAMIDPGTWLTELARTDSAQDDGTLSEAEAARRASELLDELDDMELIWYAARGAGVEPAGLRADLDRCIRELVHQADLFGAIGVRVQALAFPLRADLPTHDPDLAVTARKLVHLLDLLEEAEADRAPLAPWAIPRQGGPPLPAGLTPEPTGRIPPRQPRYAIAATPDEERAAVPSFRWRSPDGRHTARLDIPQKAPANAPLYLEFSDLKLAGQAVLLGGLRSVIDEQGQAPFDWDEVRAVEAHLPLLLVGSVRGPWELLS